MEYTPNYQVSKDYKYLAQLLREGKHVVCFVTWDFNLGREKEPMWVTDVCDARYTACEEDEQYSGFRVGCRGTMFIEAMGYHLKYVRGAENMTLDEYFAHECECHKLEFIVPTL